MENLTVTSIEQMLKWQNGEVVKLPPMVSGEDFVVKLKRPSLERLIIDGEIPNELYFEAMTIFDNARKGKKEAFTKDATEKIEEYYDKICEACMAEPTFQQLKDAGIKLHTTQRVEIYQYMTADISKLKSFRDEPTDNINNTDG